MTNTIKYTEHFSPKSSSELNDYEAKTGSAAWATVWGFIHDVHLDVNSFEGKTQTLQMTPHEARQLARKLLAAADASDAAAIKEDAARWDGKFVHVRKSAGGEE